MSLGTIILSEQGLKLLKSAKMTLKSYICS